MKFLAEGHGGHALSVAEDNREGGRGGRLVRKQRWQSVETVALSLAALLIITNLPDSCSDSDGLQGPLLR